MCLLWESAAALDHAPLRPFLPAALQGYCSPLQPDTHLIGADLRTCPETGPDAVCMLAAAAPGACCDLCRAKPGCGSFNFRWYDAARTQGTCFLKAASGFTVQHDGQGFIASMLVPAGAALQCTAIGGPAATQTCLAFDCPLPFPAVQPCLASQSPAGLWRTAAWRCRRQAQAHPMAPPGQAVPAGLLLGGQWGCRATAHLLAPPLSAGVP